VWHYSFLFLLVKIMKPIKSDNYKRILIRSVNWIGDAVMTTPAIGVIREYFPQAEITILANPLVSQVFTNDIRVDRIITFYQNGINKGIIGRIRLAAELRKHSFDLAIILPNSFDSASVPWLAGIPVRLGKSSDGRWWMLTKRYHADKSAPVRHEVEYYIELIRSFGITGSKAEPQLFLSTEEESEAANLMEKHGIRHDDFVIGVNPGATYGSAKRWYPDRFAEVARILAADWSAKVVIFGGPDEIDIAADIALRLDGKILNVAGKTTVRELMSLIKRCNFFITNDSGPMHIAAALQVPMVAIFGSTDHATTSPFTDKAVIVRKDTDCAPCKLRECPTDHRCMTAVTTAEVVAAALDLQRRVASA
jgi:heptosyltransferase-2